MSKNISKTGYVGVYKAYKSKTFYYSSSLFEDPNKKGRVRIGKFKSAEAAYKARMEYEDDIKKRLPIKIERKKYHI